jgi:TatD DNase family protein
MLIDSHAHLQDKDFAGETEAVIQRAAEAGVQKIVCVGWDLESSRLAVDIARRHRGVYAVVGVHPHDARSLTPEVISKYMIWPGYQGSGHWEMGLDFYRNLSPQEVQKQAFRNKYALPGNYINQWSL